MEDTKRLREQALEENYKRSMEITKEVVDNINNFVGMYLQYEKISEMSNPQVATVDIKAMAVSRNALQKAAAVAIVNYLVNRYNLKGDK
jgi:hypothetical protein